MRGAQGGRLGTNIHPGAQSAQSAEQMGNSNLIVAVYRPHLLKADREGQDWQGLATIVFNCQRILYSANTSRTLRPVASASRTRFSPVTLASARGKASAAR